ncbi:MAG: DUF1176 domain-containing protein [Parvibaculaceae bacterium]
MKKRSVLLALPALMALSGTVLAEGKSVRDWTAECAESLTCFAETTGSGGLAMGKTGYRLQVGRHNGEDTAWFIEFIMKNVPQPKEVMTISVDGQALPEMSESFDYLKDADGETFGIASGQILKPLFAQMKKGKTVEISFKSADGGEHKETFSLSGMVAVMLWIDEQQKRVGSSERVDMPTGVNGETEFKASDDLIAKIKARADIECGPLMEGEERQVTSYHLPGAKTLYVSSCFSGAYNFGSLFLIDGLDGLEPIAFADYSDEYGWTGTNQLVNADFDPKTGSLTSFAKGRGIGDCGTSGRWVWRQYVFQLREFSSWDDCENGKEPDEWPVVFKYKDK